MAEADGGAASSAAGDGGQSQEGSPQQTPVADGKGDGKGEDLNPYKVPDKFLADGKPDYGKLVKSYGEAEQALLRKNTEVKAEVEREWREARIAAAPATPGDYAVEEKFILGDREIVMNQADPMMQFVRQVAHANQWTQQQFNENVRGWVAQQIAAMPKWTDEAAKLGANADARHARVDGFLKGNLSDAAYQHFARQPATAGLITALEEVMELAGHPKITDDTTVIPKETLSREQLREMQRDPRYTGERNTRIDQSFVNRVRAGYRALAKNGSGA